MIGWLPELVEEATRGLAKDFIVEDDFDVCFWVGTLGEPHKDNLV